VSGFCQGMDQGNAMRGAEYPVLAPGAVFFAKVVIDGSSTALKNYRPSRRAREKKKKKKPLRWLYI
jgi:hypothetical protein